MAFFRVLERNTLARLWLILTHVFSPEQIAGFMAAYRFSPEAQLRQTQSRMKLVQTWSVQEGMRVLEIGCGQGDMTAVLANAVGASGQVTAVDAAGADYGSPVSLGDSLDQLLKSPLGPRLDLRLEFDILNPKNDFPPDAFDCIVLAHSAWYFHSPDALEKTLAKVREWGQTLCFAEWDLEPKNMDQLGHFIAVALQNQFNGSGKVSDLNIRTPLSRRALRNRIESAGWFIQEETLIDSSDLDDGKWEIAASIALHNFQEVKPEHAQETSSWLNSQLEVLQNLSERGLTRSLGSVSWIAQKSPNFSKA